MPRSACRSENPSCAGTHRVNLIMVPKAPMFAFVCWYGFFHVFPLIALPLQSLLDSLVDADFYSCRNICFLIKRGKPRRAAFEVQIMWLVGSVEYSLTLASKLCTNKFPDPQLLSKRILYALEAAPAPSATSKWETVNVVKCAGQWNAVW